MINKGEIWFVKRPGALCIIKAVITDTTERTVEIRDIGDHSSYSTPYWGNPERYTYGQLEFIEKLGEE